MFYLIETAEVVIDGSKALRSAIDSEFGTETLVQRCRNHKERNVVGHLPTDQHEQARAILQGAWKLDAKEGMVLIGQYASWLELKWPKASLSRRTREDVHDQPLGPAEQAASVSSTGALELRSRLDAILYTCHSRLVNGYMAFYRRLGLAPNVDARLECREGDSTFSVHPADYVAGQAL